MIRVALGDEPADVVGAGATVVSVITGELIAADVVIAGDRVVALADPGEYLVGKGTEVLDCTGQYASPGLIDPHTHIESSNLTVAELAASIVPRGVSTLIADPHEIANVLGVAGIDLLVDEARTLPLDVRLRVPGRVPALPAHLETSGHEVDMATTLALLDRPEAACIGGDINPALLLGADPDQLAKIEATITRHKTVGGQLPGFTGRVLDASVVTGIEDTHVAESVAEVLAQLRRGLRVLLTPRIDRLPAEEWPDLAQAVGAAGVDTRFLCLCTDDIHPNILAREGHLDARVRLAIAAGFTPVQAVQMATLNPAELMRLDRDHGSLTPGKLADIVVVPELATWAPSLVLHRGRVVARDGTMLAAPTPAAYPAWSRGTVRLPRPVTAADLELQVDHDGPVEVNVVEFGGPKTMLAATLAASGGVVQPDGAQDIAAIAVLERHRGSGAIGRGFVAGLGIRGGAVASTVNHDSHNIFVVGDSHEAMAIAANALTDAGGGYCAVVGTEVRALVALPVAGLLSEQPLAAVARGLDEVERVLLEDLHCSIPYRPLYALNFLCLPNIPDVGVTDHGIIATASMATVPALR
jgi:adenine deaminase